jgi:hypothetical protein
MFRRNREIVHVPLVTADCAIPSDIVRDEPVLAARCQNAEPPLSEAARDASFALLVAEGGHDSDNEADSVVLSELTPKAKRSLASIKGLVAKEHDLVRRSFRDALTHAKAAGEALNRIDKLVPYGHSTKVRALVCEELGISERTGRVYLQLFSGWELVEAEMARQSLIPDPSHFSIRQALAAIRTAKVERASGSDDSSPSASNSNGKRPAKDLSSGAKGSTHQTVQKARANDSPLLVPDAVFARAVELVGGEFTLDVTSEPKCKQVPAKLQYSENALFEPWFEKVFVYLTPGMAIEKWVEKLARHRGTDMHVVSECILLLPVDTASTWFGQLVSLHASILFCHQRLACPENASVAPFASLVAYIGPDHERFVETFSSLGPVLRSTETRA